MRIVIRFAAVVMCGFTVALIAGLRQPVPVYAAASCEGLMSLKLPGTTITQAIVSTASPPGIKTITGPGGAAVAMPESCRVAATLRPSSDSEIKMELWMPVSDWNGKYQAVGNGAFNGTIAYPAP